VADVTDCAACAEAGRRAKAQGFRDWRTGYACFDHAAVDLDSPDMRAWLAERGVDRDDLPTPAQRELFDTSAFGAPPSDKG
jgi:hypothetical protein